MIDWVSAKIICNHDPNKLSNGIIASLDRDGNTEWLTNKKRLLKVLIQQNSDSVSNRHSNLYFWESYKIPSGS